MMRSFLTLSTWMMAVMCLGQLPNYVPGDGLVAWYPFNGNVQDESGNGLHASEFAVAFVENRANAPASCIELSSPNSKVVTPVLGVSGGQSRTVAFWVSKVSLNEHWGFTNAVGSHQNGDPGNAFGCGFNFGNLQGVTIDVENGAVTYQSNLDSMSLGWAHYAFAVPDVPEVRAEDVLVYENGELLENVVSSVSPETLLNTLSWEYIIGGAEGFSGSLGLFEDQNLDFGNPKIDDVGFWSRALSSDEIQALYLSEWEIFGCTDPLSCNYSDAAQEDDGSCLPYGSPAGCTDALACNYESEALCEDGSCIYPPFNLTDCLEGAATCGVGTVWDTSTQSCVVESPSDSDFDGCVGMTDLLNLLSSFGTCVDEDPTDGLGDWSCGDLLGYQGYDYETVQIGDQCWFAENLRAARYSNNEELIDGQNPVTWTEIEEGAYSVFSLEQYGLLYNRHAVMDSRNVCPVGWRVSSVEDWGNLYAVSIPLGVPWGEALKSDFGWTGGWANGQDTFGFSAVPGGMRAGNTGEFFGSVGTFHCWTTSSSGEEGVYMWIYDNSDWVFEHTGEGWNEGRSVRCMQDIE